MTYALLISLVAGGLTTLYLLWSRAKIQGDLTGTQKDLKASQTESAGWKQSYTALQVSSDDQAKRLNAQITTLESQNAELLKSLPSGAIAGILQAEHIGNVPKAT